LDAAALLEPPFSVATLLGLGVDAEALDPLFDSGLLRERLPGQAEFARAESRDEILGSLAWSRKRRLCEQLAKLLSGRDETLGQAAQLYGWAHRYREARGCWVRSAQAACRQGQYEVAFGHFRRAFELWPAHEDLEDRNRHLHEMARCARHAGNFARARLAWEELLETARLDGRR
jgi:tetratricopeptide (TPR) repeat protein